MKFSFCSIAYRHREMNLQDLIIILSEFGYDGVEIWADHLTKREFSTRNVKNLVEYKGMEVSMITPYFDLTSSITRWNKSIVNTKKMAKIANVLDCPLLRVFTGNVPSRTATEEQWEQCVDGLNHMAEIADKAGVKLAIENHPNSLADTPRSIEKLFDKLDMDNVGLLLDFYNMREEREISPLDFLDRFYSKVEYIHAKNAVMLAGEVSPYRYVMDEQELINDEAGIRTLESGELDYEEILLELERRDYKGYFSIECFETRRTPLRRANEELAYCEKVLNNEH